MRNKLMRWVMLIVSLGVLVCCNERSNERASTEIVILHTNDTHSQVEPIKGMGGYEIGRAHV